MLPNDVAMMAGADGGMAAGRRVRRRARWLRPRMRAVWRTMSDFLSEYWLQYVAFEIPDATEELFFALCKANSRLQLLCYERNGAYEIGDLKEPVFVWSHVLREFPFVAVACRYGFVDEICDDSLAAIVIHFYLEVRNRRKTRDIEEFRNAGFERGWISRCSPVDRGRRAIQCRNETHCRQSEDCRTRQRRCSKSYFCSCL